MRRSEFTRAVEDEFGNRAAMLVADLALPGVGHRTAAEALADGGVKQGIPRAQALRLAADVLIATGELLRQKHPATLKDEVSSPGGTTIYGLAALEARGVRAALVEAVEAATLRGHQLGIEE